MNIRRTIREQSEDKPGRKIRSNDHEWLTRGQKISYLGLISRETDASLKDLFWSHWDSQDDCQQNIGIQTLQLPSDIDNRMPDLDTLGKYTSFLRSDHVRFWFVNHKDYYASFKSIQLADTGANIIFISKIYNLYII